MKILRIKALNINSLKGNIDIDFNDFLKDNALFAITGPTGSGKSTILDIITCSMYGRTARLTNPNELMSRHTGESFCEVEFEIKGNIYRSSWTQKRARKSAEGNFQTAKMELVDLKTEKVIITGLREVPKHIEELSGLDFDRFAQSMMLAQGSFDAFLKAKEADRSTLLEKITGTQIYAKISKEIYEKHSFYKNDIESDKKLLESIELLSQDILEEIKKNHEENKIQKLDLDKRLKELRTSSSWLETLNKLNTDSIKFDELFTEISKEKEEKREDFKKLDFANKALNITPIFTEKNSLEKVISSDKTDLENIIKTILTTKESISTNTQFYQKAKEETLKAKENLAKETSKIKEARTLQTKIDEQEKLLKTSETSFTIKTEEERTLINSSLKIQDEFEKIKIDLDDKTKYLEENKIDEKLVESITLIEQKVKDYGKEQITQRDIILKKEALEKSIFQKKKEFEEIILKVNELKEIFDGDDLAYKTIENLSINDNKNEPSYRDDSKTIEKLLSSYSDFKKLTKSKEDESLNLKTNQTEQTNLIETIKQKTAHRNEIKELLQSLRIQKDNELLIKNYEEDRSLLEDGHECFLCGSKEHPYVSKNMEINIETTNHKIIEKEKLLNTKEDELHESRMKLSKVESKIESYTLESVKLDNQIEAIKGLFQSAKITLNEQSEVTLKENLETINTNLKEITNRRKEKDRLLLLKDSSSKNLKQKEDELNTAEKQLSISEQTYNQLLLDKQVCTINLEVLKEYLTSQWLIYGLEFKNDKFVEQYQELFNKKEKYAKTKALFTNLESKRNSYEIDKKELEVKLSSIKKDIENTKTYIQTIQTNIKKLKEELLAVLNVANIDLYETQINDNFKQIQQKEQILKDEQNKLNTTIQNLENQEKILSTKLEKNKKYFIEVEQTLKTELEQNSFKDIEQYLIYNMNKEDRETLNTLCKSIEDKYNETKTLKEQTAKQLETHTKEIPTTKSLEEIQEELTNLQIKADEIQLSIGKDETTLSINEQNRQKHQSNIERLEEKQKTFKIWTKLNEMLGSADGNKFAKFAQGITLDQLINLANNHLQILSSRYELQRSVEQKQLLEIEVCDSFQGDAIRPVSTLSGGESFIVSLALALGLSELASQKISIDSLFLDEGFGTLDTDSLETALNALNKLQSSGKMVGVISHVESLKERIPLQIKVVPRGDGTSFVAIG